MSEIQSVIQSVLDRAVAEGAERGLQATVYFQGRLVADAFAGVADPATGRQVDTTTLFPVFSTTKGIVATIIHLLVERGKIGYETRIAEVWPEFAAHGKEGITLRHALNHTSGIPLMPMGIGHAGLCDWETMCAAIADLKPIAPPGAEMAYHAITYGWILGEVARRVDGRPFPRLLAEEINAPLGVEGELFIGIPDEVEKRVAILESKSLGDQPLPPSDVPRAIPALVEPLFAWMNRPDARRACIPASNGILTARAVAKHYAALLPGGAEGFELLPPTRVELATAPQFTTRHGLGDPPMNQRLGYTLGMPFSLTAFGHAGYGGSIGFADPASGIAFGFTRNRFDSNLTVPDLMEALHDAIGR